jgi:hypothetical protein
MCQTGRWVPKRRDGYNVDEDDSFTRAQARGSADGPNVFLSGKIRGLERLHVLGFYGTRARNQETTLIRRGPRVFGARAGLSQDKGEG